MQQNVSFATGYVMISISRLAVSPTATSAPSTPQHSPSHIRRCSGVRVCGSSSHLWPQVMPLLDVHVPGCLSWPWKKMAYDSVFAVVFVCISLRLGDYRWHMASLATDTRGCLDEQRCLDVRSRGRGGRMPAGSTASGSSHHTHQPRRPAASSRVRPIWSES